MRHGTSTAYKRHGCRCEACKEGNAAAARRHRANRNLRGDRYVRKDRVYSERRPCATCGEATRAKGPQPTCKPCRLAAKRGIAISADRRLAVYERDGWVCGFCFDMVDRMAPHNSPGQATLDHITPRSLGGTDDEANLRLLHRYCNNVRSNRPILTVNELAA